MMNARIIALVPNNAGVLQINVEGVRTALPACANSSVTWNVNVNTPAGQMLASALLTAFAQNLPVDITGISSCEFSGVESIGIIGVHR